MKCGSTEPNNQQNRNFSKDNKKKSIKSKSTFKDEMNVNSRAEVVLN